MNIGWTNKEEAALRTSAPLGIEAVQAALPRRTHASIAARASKLRIRIAKQRRNQFTGKIAIPENCTPEVRALVEAMNRQQFSFDRLGEQSNNGGQMLRSWRQGHDPRIGALKRALNVVGLDLAVVPLSQPAGPDPPA